MCNIFQIHRTTVFTAISTFFKLVININSQYIFHTTKYTSKKETYFILSYYQFKSYLYSRTILHYKSTFYDENTKMKCIQFMLKIKYIIKFNKRVLLSRKFNKSLINY